MVLYYVVLYCIVLYIGFNRGMPEGIKSWDRNGASVASEKQLIYMQNFII